MTKENVEIVRGMYEAHNEGRIEDVLPDMHPDLVFKELPAVPGAGTYHGREGYVEFCKRWHESFPDVRWEIERVWDQGDVVVVATRATGAGTSSGAAADMRFASMITFREGKAIRHEAFPTTDEALEAAGLSE